jgi:flagellar M-ring protein FliF
MRTESSGSNASAATRLRDAIGRTRRWVRGRRPAFRVTLVAVAAIGLAAAAYMAIPLDRDEVVFLYEDKRFSLEIAQAMAQALREEKITCQLVGNRVGVPRSRTIEARAALAKHGVAPLTIEEIEREPVDSNPWTDTQAVQADRDRRRLERQLKAIIEGYDQSIRSASVTIRQSNVRVHVRTEPKSSVVVVLDAERRPRAGAIHAIQVILTKMVPGLAPDAVSISDRSGTFFVEGGDPKSESVTKSLAHQEELRDALIEKLGQIVPGIDVDVRVEAATAPGLGPTDAKIVPPSPAPPAEELKANQPVGLEPDPAPAATVAVAEPPHQAHAGSARASIWVKVPRSYYLRIYRQNAPPNRQPSAEDLVPIHQKTKQVIENAVAIVVPKAEQAPPRIDIIPDELAGSVSTLVVPAGSPETARTLPAWFVPAALGVGVGLVTAMVLGTGVGLIAARRPAARPSRTSVRSGLSADVPSPTGPVPGPSERVRDLVRRDPEAAAGVLQRWIGRGEGGPT